MCAMYDEKNKLWGSFDEKPMIDLSMSLGQWILKRLTAHGSNVAQINDDNGVRVTFNQLRLQTIRAAQNLQKRGFESRQAFSIMANDNDHLAPIILASICLTCPIVPLHPMLSKDEICNILTKTKPSAIFCDASTYNQMSEALKGVKLVVRVFAFDQVDGLEPVDNLLVETGEENNFMPLNHDLENDVAGMFCSSGSTGPSKCARLSFGHHLFTKPAIYDAGSIVLSFDPIYWTVGIKPIIHCIHNGATRLITAKPYSPELQLKLIEKYKVNILYLPPYNLTACLKTDVIQNIDLSSMRAMFLYGCKKPSSLVPEIYRYFPNTVLISWYGTTELGRVAISMIDAQGNDSGERLLSGCVTKIVDDNGTRCGPNVNGEVRTRMKHQFLGYVDDERATAKAVDNEGFFRTGDIGHFDKNGILYIEDRKKNSIKVFYFRSMLFPLEIEEFLITLPDIQEVYVVGVPIEGDTALPAAVIVRKPNSKLSKRDVFNVSADYFPDRSKLRGGVYFVEFVPKTHSGKPIRSQITDLATEMFKAAKENDSDIQSYISDFPREFRKLIQAI